MQQRVSTLIWPIALIGLLAAALFGVNSLQSRPAAETLPASTAAAKPGENLHLAAAGAVNSREPDSNDKPVSPAAEAKAATTPEAATATKIPAPAKPQPAPGESSLAKTPGVEEQPAAGDVQEPVEAGQAAGQPDSQAEGDAPPAGGTEPSSNPVNSEAPRPETVDCSTPPAGWSRYVVKPGDTISQLAERAGSAQAAVISANCLDSTLLLAGQSLFLPPLLAPMPTPCFTSPLPGWTRHVVQAGDTLFGLGLARRTDVEQITQVNCLPSSLIYVGQAIYLPHVPVSAPRSTPASSVKTECSGLTCRSDEATGRPDLQIAAGGPNNPAFTPCSDEQGRPWISFEGESLGSMTLQQGQRGYFFACEFPDPDALSIQFNGPAGDVLALESLAYLPNPDLQFGQAQRVVVVNATCDLPTGLYTLTLDSDLTSPVSLAVNLSAPDRQRILAAPQSGAPGDAFQVYYCGYEANSRVVVDIYYQTERRPDGSYVLAQAASWPLRIGSDGWAVQPLNSAADDPAGAYALRDQAEDLTGSDLIWLLE